MNIRRISIWTVIVTSGFLIGYYNKSIFQFFMDERSIFGLMSICIIAYYLYCEKLKSDVKMWKESYYSEERDFREITNNNRKFDKIISLLSKKPVKKKQGKKRASNTIKKRL